MLTSLVPLQYDLPNYVLLDKLFSDLSSSYLIRAKLKRATLQLLRHWRETPDPYRILALVLRLVGRLKVENAFPFLRYHLSRDTFLHKTALGENLHRRALRSLSSLLDALNIGESEQAARIFDDNISREIGDPPVACFAAVCWGALHRLGHNPMVHLVEILNLHITGKLPEDLDWVVNNFARIVPPDRHCEFLSEVWKTLPREHKELYLSILLRLRYRISQVSIDHTGEALLVMDLHEPDRPYGLIYVNFSDSEEVSEGFLHKLNYLDHTLDPAGMSSVNDYGSISLNRLIGEYERAVRTVGE